MAEIVVAGGCFWCLDAAFRQFRGVSDVISAYTGGDAADPTYEQVCTGSTGHAEAVVIQFDEDLVPESVLLDAFFTIHDPTQLNRQGDDIGTQYRSAMFYADEAQKERFLAALERARAIWGDGIVTVIEPLGKVWEAEEYHQNFFAKNPTQGYCVAVATPKMVKVRRNFAEFL